MNRRPQRRTGRRGFYLPSNSREGGRGRASCEQTERRPLKLPTGAAAFVPRPRTPPGRVAGRRREQRGRAGIERRRPPPRPREGRSIYIKKYTLGEPAGSKEWFFLVGMESGDDQFIHGRNFAEILRCNYYTRASDGASEEERTVVGSGWSSSSGKR